MAKHLAGICFPHSKNVAADRAGIPQLQVATMTVGSTPSMRERMLAGWLGSGVIVGTGVTIGTNTVVGAGAVVVCDLPAR